MIPSKYLSQLEKKKLGGSSGDVSCIWNNSVRIPAKTLSVLSNSEASLTLSS